MPYVDGKYYSERELEDIKRKLTDDQFEKFLISGVVGAVTGSSVLGAVVGGSLLGGIVGDLLEGTDDSFF